MTAAVLGIDVGYAKKKRTTGLCLLTIDDTNIQWRLLNTGAEKSLRRVDLQCLIPKGTTLLGVGIDGPLASKLALVEHYRSAEALLSRSLLGSRCRPGPTSGGGQNLHRHATELAKLVIKLQEEAHLTIARASHPDPVCEYRIVEAFPTAFLSVLFSDNDFPDPRPKRGKVSDRYWEIALEEGYLGHVLETLAPEKTVVQDIECITDHDQRAAFVCALAALCVAKNWYVAVGDSKSGEIILPDFDVWGGSPQGWAENALAINLESVRRNKGRHLHLKDARVLRNRDRWMP